MMSIGYLLATAVLAADAITQEKAIAIASEFLRSPKFDITSYEISAERCTTPPCDGSHIPAERFGGHTIWLVSFTPRKQQFWGHYAVYVAADTGEILGSRLYR
jgi:hypothetical protein